MAWDARQLRRSPSRGRRSPARGAGRFITPSDATATNELEGGNGDDHLSATASGSNPDGSATATNTLDGGEGDDELTALIFGDGSSELFGGAGDDELSVFDGDGNLLDGGLGSDGLRGGENDDALVIDLDDLTGTAAGIDGGDGSDQLLVGVDLDLTTIADDRIANIERVDLASGAANRLTLWKPRRPPP